MNNFIQTEVDMSPETSQEYQRAVEEAANAFMKMLRAAPTVTVVAPAVAPAKVKSLPFPALRRRMA